MVQGARAVVEKESKIAAPEPSLWRFRRGSDLELSDSFVPPDAKPFLFGISATIAPGGNGNDNDDALMILK